MSTSRTCWSVSFSAIAFFTYSWISLFVTYVAGHIRQVGCGSCAMTVASGDAATTKASSTVLMEPPEITKKTLEPPRSQRARRILVLFVCFVVHLDLCGCDNAIAMYSPL